MGLSEFFFLNNRQQQQQQYKHKQRCQQQQQKSDAKHQQQNQQPHQQQQHQHRKKQHHQQQTQLQLEQHQQNSPTKQHHQIHEHNCLSKLTPTPKATLTKFSTQASCNDSDFVLNTTSAAATPTATSKSKRAHRTLLSAVYKNISLLLQHDTAAKASTTTLATTTKTNKLIAAASSTTFPWLLAAFLLSAICIEPTITATATTTTAIKTTTLVAATTSGAAVAAITASSTFDSVNVAAAPAAAAAVATTKILATLQPPFEFEIDRAAVAVANIDDVAVVMADEDDDGEEAVEKVEREAVVNGQTAGQQEEEEEHEEEEEQKDNNNKNNNNVPSSNEQQLLEFYKQAQHHHHQQQQQQQQQQQHHRHRQRDTLARDSNVDTLPTVTVDSSPSTSLLTAASLALKVVTTSTTTTAPPPTTTTEDIPCEPKVLDEVPTEPFYDFTDLTDEAAHEFTEYLATKFTSSNTPPSAHSISDELKEKLRSRANEIASNALNQDDNLLAFAIAAPTVDTVVVKFRDNVTIPPDQKHHKSSFLGSYWRELGLAWNSTDGSQEWGAPFRDCNLLRGRWLWPFRVSFVEFKIKIVAVVFIAADEDLCNDGLEEIFGRRHGCDRNTTFCLLTEVKPFASRDAYTCICRESFYLPNSSIQGFTGDIVEQSEGYENYSCIPCPGGCSSCDQYGVCLFGVTEELVSMENLLHVSVGSVLGACILCCIVLGVIVFQQRKCKAIASGMWTVLETILLGIVLLYTSVAVHFFPASTERCLLEPWLRELGFITCYGAIILKLYRHLVDFRTRKAHRWVLRDVDLLKYLGTMVFAVICYMAAFTASSLDLIETAHLEGLRELRTNTCHPLKWELVTQVSEVLILCFGLHLAFASRNANTQFRDRQFLVASLVLEFLVSSCYYILRLIYLPELSPGAILLALFLRSQLTNTISLGLIFVPKLWFQHKQVRSLAHDLSIRLPVDAFKGSHDVGHHLGGGYAGLCLGDPDIGELTISEMSPEDIRAELKRLYTQLEILKNKTLRQDNPHISKRRGGRKQGHRRFSLQALSAKHRSNKHHQDVEITEAEPSRTPEDSVCSAEGPTDTYAEISGISHSMLSHSAISHSK